MVSGGFKSYQLVSVGITGITWYQVLSAVEDCPGAENGADGEREEVEEEWAQEEE